MLSRVFLAGTGSSSSRGVFPCRCRQEFQAHRGFSSTCSLKDGWRRHPEQSTDIDFCGGVSLQLRTHGCSSVGNSVCAGYGWIHRSVLALAVACMRCCSSVRRPCFRLCRLRGLKERPSLASGEAPCWSVAARVIGRPVCFAREPPLGPKGVLASRGSLHPSSGVAIRLWLGLEVAHSAATARW